MIVDRILSFEKDKKLSAEKLIKDDELWVKGHFPDNPIMPGVLLIEACAQICALLALMSYPEYR